MSTLDRFSEWCRRNPRVAAVAACNLVLLLTGAIISTLAAVRIRESFELEQDARRAAEQAKLQTELRLQAALEEIGSLKRESRDMDGRRQE
jgi:hypothetical protein